MSRTREPFALSPETTRALLELSVGAGVSLSTTLLVVAGTLVYRYAGWDDITLVVQEGRLVSLNLSGDPTFRDVLERVRASWAPELCDRDSLQVALASELQGHTFVHPLARAGATLAGNIADVTLEYDLTHPLLGGSLDYDADQYDSRIMRSVTRHVTRIADMVAADELVRFSKIDILTSEERRQLQAWNDTACGYPEGTIASLFELQAARTPDSVALRYRGRTLTYGELDSRAAGLARLLRTKGVTRSTRVGLYFDRTMDAVVAILGVLKAGGAYVPLDCMLPEQRLRMTVEDARMRLVISSGGMMSQFPASEIEIVPLEAADAGAGDDGPVTSGATPDDAAYVIYTSGSTGRPKAIVGTHRSVINGLNDPPFRLDDAEEICCLNSPLSVGFSLSRLFLPLMCGLPLVIVPEGDDKDLARFVGVLEEERVTNIALVTPVVRQLVRSGLARRLSRVHTVAIGGAPLTRDVLDAFQALMPQATLLHGYGSTEIGGVALLGKVTRPPSAPPSSVGRPFANTQVYVIDPSMNLVPIGVAGEICVAAPHLSQGYLNQPELSAQKFVRNPFGSGRLYRTGDVGRFLPDGDVELLGRIDDQVKIRGYRVELPEIEAVLAAHPDIDQAAMAAHEIDGETRLVAYVVARAGSSLDSAGLRDYVAGRLPTYMQPWFVTWIEALPMTPIGKVDRTALQPPDPAHLALATGYVAPSGEIEQDIAALWTATFGLERIGSRDHFLELGGDSLMAALLATRIGQHFAVYVPVVLLLSDRPTIAALAEYVEAEMSAMRRVDHAAPVIQQ